MILSVHSTNGDVPPIRPIVISAKQMLRLLRKRLRKVDVSRLTKKVSSVRGVHHLRVATRKAYAALTVCKPLIPKSLVRKLERVLKSQRKALGAVRDWDVLIARVLGTPADEKSDLRTDLLLFLACERERAWRKACRDWEESGSVRSLGNTKRLAKACRISGEELFRVAVHRPLSAINEGVSGLQRGEALDITALHQFRIACKELRYLLEYQKEVAGDGFEQLVSASSLELLSEAQQRLGDLHDCSRRPELLRSAHRPANKGVHKWVRNAISKAESRLPGEIERYLRWQRQADFAGMLSRLAS